MSARSWVWFITLSLSAVATAISAYLAGQNIGVNQPLLRVVFFLLCVILILQFVFKPEPMDDVHT